MPDRRTHTSVLSPPDTRRKKTATASQFAALLEDSAEMMALVDAEGTFLYAGPSTTKILGYAVEDLIGKNAFRLVHPDDQAHTRALLADLVKKPGRRVVAEYRLRASDGTWHWMEGAGRNLLDDPEVGAVVVNYRDITKRRRVEREREALFEIISAVNATSRLDELLPRIHAALRQVVYAENCFVALHDPEKGTFSFPFFVDRFDEAPPPIKVGRSCSAYVFRTGRPMLIPQRVFDELASQGEVELVGTPSPAWLGVPLRTPARTIGVLVVQHYEDDRAYDERDREFLASVGGQIALAIERKLTEDTLRRSEANYRSLVQGAPYGIYRATQEGALLGVNPALVEMLGYSSEAELAGQNLVTDVYREPGTHQGVFGDAPERVRGQEALWKRKDGTPITVRLSGRRVREHGCPTVCYEMIAENVTEQRLLEQQLRQATKMEAVGRLAGGVAHDFNNLLMVIKGHSELMLDRLSPEDWHTRKVEQIQKAADRAAALTKQLLAFSRMQVLQPRVLDLNAVVNDMGKLLPRMIGEDIELVLRTHPDLGRVKADPSQLEQVIMNLAVNARDAMPEGGKITIETQNVELDETYARLHPPLVPGRYVLLAVTDTGVGMNAETQAHIFEPFFTTKEKGKGTGLGLATVYGVVKQSGGYIWVYSEVGQGTTFKIYLPRVEEAADVARTGRTPAELPRGTETILVAEDEAEVRELAREFLGQCGYNVLQARDGAEALELAARHPGTIHLLVTDMVMPGMSGRELATRLMETNPDLKVLFMSGYTEYVAVRSGEVSSDEPMLSKPFTRSTLARTVHHVLHHPSAGWPSA